MSIHMNPENYDAVRKPFVKQYEVPYSLLPESSQRDRALEGQSLRLMGMEPGDPLAILQDSLEVHRLFEGDYPYFIHPISDGIPRMDPSVLEPQGT